MIRPKLPPPRASSGRADTAGISRALFKARYPQVVLDEAKQYGFEFTPGDMALISQSIDMLGVNWYLRFVVDEKGAIVPVPGATVTQMGWEINSHALEPHADWHGQGVRPSLAADLHHRKRCGH